MTYAPSRIDGNYPKLTLLKGGLDNPKEKDDSKKSPPPPPTDMEARIAQLESDVEYIKRDISDLKTEVKEFRSESRSEFRDIRKEAREDFRISFTALIGLGLGLAGLMAKGFHWL